MKGCNYVRSLIDDADKPDLLSFEVNQHIGHCGDCERFANERAALRGLLASDRRVSVPMNFDALLKARLVEVKERRSFVWLSAPGYMRLGAATAGLVIMFFAAQYSGLFSDQVKRPVESTAVAIAPPTSPPAATPPSSNIEPPGTASTAPRLRQNYSPSFRNVRGGGAPDRTARDGYFTAEDGGVVLVRGHNGEMDVPMPSVSVGAQSLVYVSAGQRPVRNTASSF